MIVAPSIHCGNGVRCLIYGQESGAFGGENLVARSAVPFALSKSSLFRILSANLIWTDHFIICFSRGKNFLQASQK